jgi:hypothetical protein
MSIPLFLTKISCLGPGVRIATLDFCYRANAIIGISDTGKSFVLDLIDFMLGGETLKRIPPEGNGYDTILLGLKLPAKGQVTIRRAMAGGNAELLEGDCSERTGGNVIEILTFEAKKKHRTISQFFLDEMNMGNVILVAKKTKGVTERLGIRTLAKLNIISIHGIITELSPVHTGQFVRATPERSLFKYLLTGVDDSALIAVSQQRKSEEREALRNRAGLEFLKMRRAALEKEGKDEQAILAMLREAKAVLDEIQSTAGAAEEELATQRRRIRRLADLKELAERRVREITGLLSRFGLLAQHYASDIDRLSALEEAANAVEMLAPSKCPLCGAAEAAQDHSRTCEADLPNLAQAAAAEIFRIRHLERDLSQTIERAEIEQANLGHKIAKASAELDEALVFLPEIIASTRASQASVVATAKAMLQLQEQLRVFDGLTAIEQSIRPALENAASTALPPMDLPREPADNLAKVIAGLLQAWKVPGMERIFFAVDKMDIQINGKIRGAQGTGLRALTHAAFSIGLMIYCLENDLPHPGFVVIDSPLNPYRENDAFTDEDVELSKLNVDDLFYCWLATKLPVGQVIVLENRETRQTMTDIFKIHRFKSGGSSREGFFPVPAQLQSSI